MISHHLFDKFKTKFLICQISFQKNSDFFQSRVRYKYLILLEKLYKDNTFFYFVNSVESFFLFFLLISLIKRESGLYDILKCPLYLINGVSSNLLVLIILLNKNINIINICILRHQ